MDFGVGTRILKPESSNDSRHPIVEGFLRKLPRHGGCAKERSSTRQICLCPRVSRDADSRRRHLLLSKGSENLWHTSKHTL